MNHFGKSNKLQLLLDVFLESVCQMLLYDDSPVDRRVGSNLSHEQTRPSAEGVAHPWGDFWRKQKP